MPTFLAVALCLAAAAPPARATNFDAVRPGARAAGMGGAFTAVADDPFAPYYNPAGPANAPYLEAGGAAGRYLSPVGTLSNMTLAYLRPYAPIPTATLGVSYYAGRQTDGGDKDVFLFNYAQEVKPLWLPLAKPLKVGGNFKFINVDKGRLGGGKFGMGFDAGALARFASGMQAGAVLYDLTSDVGVPRAGLALGTAYSWRRRFLFSGDLRIKGGHAEFHPGVEVSFHQGLLRARAGKGEPLDGVGTLAAGLGVNFSPVILDVAMTLPASGVHRRGGGFQASFQYRFGAPSFAGQFVGQAAAQAEGLRAEISSLDDRRRTLEQQAAVSQTNKTVVEGELRVLERRVREAQDEHRALLKRNEELRYKAAEAASAASSRPRAPAPALPRKPEPPAWPKRHPVGAGDTLRSLASRYYGDPNLWERIYEANREKVDRGLPVPGQMLDIPAPR